MPLDRSDGNSKRGARPVSTLARNGGAGSPAKRAPRADSIANRARILDAAVVAFDEIGVGVSLDEIARRAGVGAGTVHRHFPTKDSLIDASIASAVDALAREAKRLTRAPDPVEAFCSFFETMIARGAASHALADRLGGVGWVPGPAVAQAVTDLRASIATLLRRAQRAGGIRSDIDAGGLDAMMAGAHAIHIHPDGGEHLVRLVCDAMRTT